MVELKRKVTLKTKSAMPEDDMTEKVHLKKKVTIKEKHEEPNPIPYGGDGGGQTPPPKPPKGKKWILWLIIIVILAIGGYLWYSNSGKTSSEGSPSDSTEVARTDSLETSKPDSIVGKDSSRTAAVGANGNSDLPSATKQNKESRQQSETTQTVDNTNEPSSEATTTQSVQSTEEEPDGSVEKTANEVVKGIYGNGNVRKNKLGNRYQEIQNRVNEMYRQGLVH